MAWQVKGEITVHVVTGVGGYIGAAMVENLQSKIALKVGDRAQVDTGP